MRQLTSLDVQFLAMESPRTYGHVSSLAVYDPSSAPGGDLERADICRLVGERLHLLDPFRWKLVEVPLSLDRPYWAEDPHFDLDFHIRDTAVAPPGGPTQVAEQVARICSRPLDRSHPLWELYLIHGIEGGRVGLLTKVHHAVVDGVSGAEILTTLLDLSPEGREVPPPKHDMSGERLPGQAEMLVRGLAGMPLQPLRAMRLLPEMLPNLQDATFGRLPGAGVVSEVTSRLLSLGRSGASHAEGGLLDGPTVRPPRTRFNSRISPHRRFAYGTLSLDRIKAIKKEMGITVNDVVVAICATAVRNWLDERGELPEEPLVAMVPVSVRTEEQKGTFGNRVSAMFAPIPTNIADPHERLMTAHETLRVAKDRHAALPATLMQDATQFIPSAVAAQASRLTMQLATGPNVRPLLNLVISNVPGPRESLYLAGAELQAIYPVSVITDGVGLNITCMSYRDGIDFGIVVDREQVDDAWPLMEALERAVEEVDEVVCGKGPKEPVAG